MEPKYILELTSEQVRVLRRACEILSRLHMCQFDMVIEEVLYSKEYYYRLKDIYEEDFQGKVELIRKLEEDLKRLLTPELLPNSYYGITSDQISSDATVSYDLNQVLRHCQSWEENPLPEDRTTIQTVSYDTPMRFGKEPLAKIRVKGKKNVKRSTSSKV